MAAPWGFHSASGMQYMGNNPHLLTPQDYPPPPAYDVTFGMAPLPIPIAAPPMAFPAPAIGIAAAPIAFQPPPMTWAPPPPVALPVAANPLPVPMGGPPFPPPFTGPDHAIPGPYTPWTGTGPAPHIPQMPQPGSNLHLPGGMPPGYNLLMAKEYCCFNQLMMDSPPWEGDNATDGVEIRKFVADCTWNAAQLIQALRPGKDCADWMISEVVETGSGKWVEGTSVLIYDAAKATLPLSDLGWTGARRDGQKGPVWVWLHKK